MRKLLTTLAAFAATALIAATSANAAAHWSCEGADYVCGGSNTSAAQSKSNQDASEATSNRAARQARAHKAKSSDTASVSSDDDQPVHRKARRQHVASAVSEDDQPAPRRRARHIPVEVEGGSSFSGKASYYWEPQALASGGRFNPNAMTAAHKTLAFGTRVRVTNQHNGQSVDVIINDRGPYVAGRVIDLSKAAAQAISMTGSGVVPVSVRILGRG